MSCLDFSCIVITHIFPLCTFMLHAFKIHSSQAVPIHASLKICTIKAFLEIKKGWKNKNAANNSLFLDKLNFYTYCCDNVPSILENRFFSNFQGCRAGAKRLRLLGFSWSRSHHLGAVLGKYQFYKQILNEMHSIKVFFKDEFEFSYPEVNIKRWDNWTKMIWYDIYNIVDV